LNFVRRTILCYISLVLVAFRELGGKIMHIADDPMLALIVRFVGDISHLNLSDKEFLHVQITAVEQYVAGFPPREREMRALEWIEAYAREYRQRWQKRGIVDASTRTRCPDCPLTGGDPSVSCTIHDRWIKLLRRYAANGLSSSEYVKRALELLNEHKNELKVHHRPTRPHGAHAPMACRT